MLLTCWDPNQSFCTRGMVGTSYLEGTKEQEKLCHLFQTGISQLFPMKKPQSWGRPHLGKWSHRNPLSETAKSFSQEGIYSLQDCRDVKKALTSFPSIFKEQNWLYMHMMGFAKLHMGSLFPPLSKPFFCCFQTASLGPVDFLKTCPSYHWTPS